MLINRYQVNDAQQLSNVPIITTMLDNIKSFLQSQKKLLIQEFLSLVINFLFIMVAFFAGVLYERDQMSRWYQLQIHNSQEVLSAWNSFVGSTANDALFVASKNGTKVYPTECSYAKRIKDENKIFFNNLKEAHELGYEESIRCS